MLTCGMDRLWRGSSCQGRKGGVLQRACLVRGETEWLCGNSVPAGDTAYGVEMAGQFPGGP